MLDVDGSGLDVMDRKLLQCVLDKFGGGPVGIDNLKPAARDANAIAIDIERLVCATGQNSNRAFWTLLRLPFDLAFRCLLVSGAEQNSRMRGEGQGRPFLVRDNHRRPARGDGIQLLCELVRQTNAAVTRRRASPRLAS